MRVRRSRHLVKHFEDEHAPHLEDKVLAVRLEDRPEVGHHARRARPLRELTPRVRGTQMRPAKRPQGVRLGYGVRADLLHNEGDDGLLRVAKVLHHLLGDLHPANS
jgi:hypothetical protein